MPKRILTGTVTSDKNEKTITTDDSPTKVFVIPTNEELVIARDTAWVVKKLMEQPQEAAAIAG